MTYRKCDTGQYKEITISEVNILNDLAVAPTYYDQYFNEITVHTSDYKNSPGNLKSY